MSEKENRVPIGHTESEKFRAVKKYPLCVVALHTRDTFYRILSS